MTPTQTMQFKGPQKNVVHVPSLTAIGHCSRAGSLHTDEVHGKRPLSLGQALAQLICHHLPRAHQASGRLAEVSGSMLR